MGEDGARFGPVPSEKSHRLGNGGVDGLGGEGRGLRLGVVGSVLFRKI